MLGRSELPVVERSARLSVHYWRNNMCKSVSSWTKRTYQCTQRTPLAGTLVPPPINSLSHRSQGLMHVHSPYETKDILQLFCLSGWIDQFQKHIEDFI